VTPANSKANDGAYPGQDDETNKGIRNCEGTSKHVWFMLGWVRLRRVK